MAENLQAELDEFLGLESQNKSIAKDGDDEMDTDTTTIEEGDSSETEDSATDETSATDGEAGEDSSNTNDASMDADDSSSDNTSSDSTNTTSTLAQLNPDLVEQNKQLLAVVNNLLQQQIKPEETKKEKIKDIIEEDLFKEVADELGLDDIGTKKLGAFIQLLQSRTAQTAVEQALQATPSQIKDVMTTQKTMDELHDQFYKEHVALVNFKPLVSQAARQIADQNPNTTIEEILTQAAQIAYKTLGLDLKKIKVNKETDAKNGDESGKRKKPAFANTSSVRKPAVKKSDFDRQIDDMLVGNI